MIFYEANAKPLDVLDLLPARILLLLLAALCAWLVFDTRRALKQLLHLFSDGRPLVRDGRSTLNDLAGFGSIESTLQLCWQELFGSLLNATLLGRALATENWQPATGLLTTGTDHWPLKLWNPSLSATGI